MTVQHPRRFCRKDCLDTCSAYAILDATNLAESGREPMSKMRLYVFHTESVRVDRAILLHERNPLAVTGLFRGKDEQIVLLVSVHLIVHPAGVVLIDTGWDTIYAAKRPKQRFGMVDTISAPIIAADEGMGSKLKSVGLHPEQIDHVFISRMDFDHASGLRLVRAERDICTAQKEWAACSRFSMRYVDVWSDVCGVRTFDYWQSGVGRSYDVFGDGTLLLVHTPGHSRGMFSVMLRGSREYIVLGSDAAYLPESFSQSRLPGFLVNAAQAEKSLGWLLECRKEPLCRGVFINHDPTECEQMMELEL